MKTQREESIETVRNIADSMYYGSFDQALAELRAHDEYMEELRHPTRPDGAPEAPPLPCKALSFAMSPEAIPAMPFDRGYISLQLDYSNAKQAQRELSIANKVIWLLLRKLGEPFVIDDVSIEQVPIDAVVNMIRSDASMCITLEAI